MRFIKLHTDSRPIWVNFDLVTDFAPSNKGSKIIFATDMKAFEYVLESPEEILALLEPPPSGPVYDFKSADRWGVEFP